MMAKVVLEVEGLLDIQEALDQLQIGYATLYRWIKKGQLFPVRIGNRTYITRADVERVRSLRPNSSPQSELGPAGD